MPSNITKRGSTFYFRVRIPSRLVAAYGKKLVSLSLRTTDKSEARARAREHAVELRRELQLLERHAPTTPHAGGTVLHLSDAEIERLCTRFRAGALADDEQARIQGLAPFQVEFDLDFYEYALPKMRRAFAEGDVKSVDRSLQHFLTSVQMKIPRQSPVFGRLALRFQQAELEVVEALLKRRKGEAVPIPPMPSDNVTLDDVLRCWKTQSTERDPKTVRAFELAFLNFAKQCSAPSASLIHKSDAVAFRTAMVGSGTYGAATIKRQLSFLRAAFQCGVNDGILERNPFDAVKVAPARTVTTKSRSPLSIDDLNKIFCGPVYQPEFVPRKSLGDACHWLPLLSLFHGARLEEMAQLQKADICIDTEFGPHISINARNGKKLKTESSARNIPLHPVLVELGFLGYVKRQEGPRLFPALRADKYGKLSTQFSTWFGRYLDGLGITDPSLVFHSARHTFIQECKDKADVIPPEVREAIVGHLSATHISRVYGHALYPLGPQVAAMKHVTFKGLDLSALRARAAQVLPG